MSATAYAAASQRQTWIVSAWWDLAYVVITPFLIVPIVLALVRRWLTPEEVSLAVIAFASLGHHLPGFMRAYGDRELFLRYRMRFILAPLLIFAVALLFSPPSALASRLGLHWSHLHGLELILLVWGTWHGLMQTYGFMRIYDVRMGINDLRSAWLDHALCLAVFVTGFVFSDWRIFGFAQGMWESGLPLFGPEWLQWTRLIVGGAGLCVLAVYLLNLACRKRRGEPISLQKLLLIATTAWFYWYIGRMSINVLVGLAMFEIYHAVQYDAIVWTYNRRLFHRAGERFGPLGFLFRDRWSMLGMYLAAIAAYGSIRYFTVDTEGYVFRSDSQDTHQWLTAMFVTSACLHFYYDGFIWKVSERKTQQNLVDGEATNAIAERVVPSLVHTAKWAVLLLIAGGLLLAEHFQRGNPHQRKAQRLQALAALVPNLPESQALLCRDALSRGDSQSAIQHAERTVALRPRSHSAHADLGLALMHDGQLDRAQQSFEKAIDIEPDYWAYRSNLGMILARQGKVEQAESQFRDAIDLRPDREAPRRHLVDFYLQQKRTQDAEREIREIANRFPDSFTAEAYQVMTLSKQAKHDEAVRLASYLVAGDANNWRAQFMLGAALNASGDGKLAIGPLETARRLQPQSAAVNYHLGLAHFQAGSPRRAIKPLMRAVRLDPQFFDAQFLAGNVLLVLQKTDAALQAYERCRKLRPNDENLCANLGGVLTQIGRDDQAEAIYREGLKANPDSDRLHYNLGVLLWQQGEDQEARKHILRAEQLGMEIPPGVSKAISP